MTGIGDRLYPGRSLPEGIVAMGGAAWALVISADSPSREETSVISAGLIDVAVDLDGPALVWMLRAQPEADRILPVRRGMMRGRHRPRIGVGWSACVWAWWDRHQPLHEREDGRGLAQVLLVHSRTTQVRAMRSLELPPAIVTQLAIMEAAAIDAGRDQSTLERVHTWTLTASSAEIEARAAKALVRTGVREKAS